MIWISEKKSVNARVIEIIKERVGEVSPAGQKMAKQEVNDYLKENGLGILILSRFDKNGKTSVKLDLIRTHEKHIKETFKTLFENNPVIKQKIIELLNEEQRCAEDKSALNKMVC